MCHFAPVTSSAILLYDLVLEITWLFHYEGFWGITGKPEQVLLETTFKLSAPQGIGHKQTRQENTELQWVGKNPLLSSRNLVLVLILLTRCISFEKYFSEIIYLIKTSVYSFIKLESNRNLPLNCIHA